MLKQKIKDWSQRYLLAEIVSTVTALAAASIARFWTHSALASAFAGSWGETFGFYGFFLFREVRASRRQHQRKSQQYGIFSFFRNLRNLIFEFGVAEWLDSFLIRPFFMYFFPKMLGNFVIGIVGGKIAADIAFYIGVITAYELKKKHLKD